MIVQVDERTDLLGYRLQCGAVPYKPNLRVSKPTILPVSTTLRRNSVFSQQCTVSHTPPIPNSLWTIANKQSVVKQSTNSRVFKSGTLFGSPCFPPWSQTKRTCALQISAGLVPICQTTPFSLHNLFFSSIFILFLVSNMVKKKSVPRRWASPPATVPAAAFAVPVPVPPQTPRLPPNLPPSLPSYVNTAYEHGRPAGLTTLTWVPFHGAWILQAPTATPALWLGSGGATFPGVPRRSMRRAPRLTPAGVHWVWTWDPPGPSVPVPEEWVIPPRHGPLALPHEELLFGVEDVEVSVEVESFGPEHQRAATAMVASALLAVFLTAYEHFFANMYLTWMAIHGGQFARNLLLLLGTASGSCSSSTRFRASSFFSSRRSVRSNFL